METNYRFISDVEPSNADLEVIMKDALISAKEKTEVAKKNSKKMFDDYFEKTKLKFSKIIINND